VSLDRDVQAIGGMGQWAAFWWGFHALLVYVKSSRIRPRSKGE
jgi:hypothetical protein